MRIEEWLKNNWNCWRFYSVNMKWWYYASVFIKEMIKWLTISVHGVLSSLTNSRHFKSPFVDSHVYGREILVSKGGHKLLLYPQSHLELLTDLSDSIYQKMNYTRVQECPVTDVSWLHWSLSPLVHPPSLPIQLMLWYSRNAVYQVYYNTLTLHVYVQNGLHIIAAFRSSEPFMLRVIGCVSMITSVKTFPLKCWRM